MSRAGHLWEEKGKDQTEIRFLLKTLQARSGQGFYKQPRDEKEWAFRKEETSLGLPLLLLTLAATLRTGLGPNSVIREGQKKVLGDGLLCFITI